MLFACRGQPHLNLIDLCHLFAWGFIDDSRCAFDALELDSAAAVIFLARSGEVRVPEPRLLDLEGLANLVLNVLDRILEVGALLFVEHDWQRLVKAL